jgi:hypothetical protein
MAAYLYEYYRVSTPSLNELNKTETRTPCEGGWFMYGEYPHHWMVRKGAIYEGNREGCHGDYNNVILDSADDLHLYYTMVPWPSGKDKIMEMLCLAETKADALDRKITELRKSPKPWNQRTMGELHDGAYETAERTGIASMRKRIESYDENVPDYVAVGGCCSSYFF